MSVKKMTVEPSITVVETPIDDLVLSSSMDGDSRIVNAGVTVVSVGEELGIKLDEAKIVTEDLWWKPVEGRLKPLPKDGLFDWLVPVLLDGSTFSSLTGLYSEEVMIFTSGTKLVEEEGDMVVDTSCVITSSDDDTMVSESLTRVVK